MVKSHSVHWLTASLLCISLSSKLMGDSASEPFAITEVSLQMEDIDGEKRFPLKTGDAKASALFFVTHDCPISNAYSPELARLNKEYGKKGINLMLIYVDPDATTAMIRNHLKEFSLTSFTAIPDKKHYLVKATGATVTPEVAVILPDGNIAYRGRIDNMYPALGQRRRVITEPDLRNALNAIIAGQPVELNRTQAIGCYVPNL